MFFGGTIMNNNMILRSRRRSKGEGKKLNKTSLIAIVIAVVSAIVAGIVLNLSQ
jgi:hypothetical protein